MKKGAIKDYDFGDKNEWRRVIWNRILRLTNGRERSELSLYLSGPDDLDRTVAINRRVPNQNLIAIDRCRVNVSAVRAEGNPGICGEIVDVLTTWPQSPKVCTIFLDLCQGFQKLDDLGRIRALTGVHPALRTAVIAINMQRGRDAESNAIRDITGDFYRKHLQAVFPDQEFDPLHRGIAFATWYMSLYVGTCDFWRFGDRAELGVIELFKMFRPKFYTYRSGGLRFDSVVMLSGGELFELDPRHHGNKSVVSQLYCHGKKSIALSTAATLAVRTRRLRMGC